MCGLFTIVSLSDTRIDRELVERCTAALHHRGPDERVVSLNGNLGTGFCRLSINDLEHGGQPLHNEDGSLTLLCNGEIYNSPALREELIGRGHGFKTRSDCEVIVHLYEEDPAGFVERLEGMFAFLLIDSRRSIMLLARDSFGIKPLVYARTPKFFMAGSESKALLASGLLAGTLDIEAVQDAFVFGYIPGEATAFAEIRTLAPATIAELNLRDGSWRTREYWHPEFAERTGFGELARSGIHASRLHDALSGAVRSHTLSDVPVGAYLSGGIDSTVITLLLKEALGADAIDTYSIAFSEADFDESPIFRASAEEMGVRQSVLTTSPSDAELFPQVIRHVEQPQFSPLDVPLNRLAALVRAQGRKVVLCGEGADELLGGYLGFPFSQIRRALLTPAAASLRPTLLPRALSFLRIHPDSHPMFERALSEEACALCDRWGYFPAWLPHWLERERLIRNIFPDRPANRLAEHPVLNSLGDVLRSRYPRLDPFDRAVFAELKTRLPNYILHRADRNSMAHSVEARVPFLDRHAAAAALAVPPLLKGVGFREKSILRKAFAAKLPQALNDRRKVGYLAPNEWLWRSGANSEPVQAAFESGLCALSPYLDRKPIAELQHALHNAVARPEWTVRESEIGALLTGIASVGALHALTQGIALGRPPSPQASVGA